MDNMSTTTWSNGADAIIMAGPIHHSPPPVGGFVLLMLIVFALFRSVKR